MLPRRHIPNAITIARLVLTAACIAFLSMVDLPADRQHPWLTLGLIAFLLAAASDWLDGFLARKWQAVSRFGRIMDPLADKVLVLGVFTVLAGPAWVVHITKGEDGPVLLTYSVTGVAPWMVVLMLTRELLVTALRSAVESSGTAFGAVALGKLKMGLQSVTIAVILVVVLVDPFGQRLGRWFLIPPVLLYATVLVTVLSAWPYVAAAVRANTRHNAKPREVTPED